jgi:hypothetical protein
MYEQNYIRQGELFAEFLLKYQDEFIKLVLS